MLTDTNLSVSLLKTIKLFKTMSKNTQKMDRPQVAEFVTRDLEIVVSFINLVRNNPEILNALVDVIYARVTEDELKKEEAEKQAKLEFNG